MQENTRFPKFSCVAAAAVDALESAIMPIVHSEPAVSIEPSEAAEIESIQLAGRTERLIACGFAPESNDVVVDNKDVIFVCTLHRRPKQLAQRLHSFLKTCTDALEEKVSSWNHKVNVSLDSVSLRKGISLREITQCPLPSEEFLLLRFSSRP